MGLWVLVAIIKGLVSRESFAPARAISCGTRASIQSARELILTTFFTVFRLVP